MIENWLWHGWEWRACEKRENATVVLRGHDTVDDNSLGAYMKHTLRTLENICRSLKSEEAPISNE